MDRKNLINILETVARGLERNSILPIYEHFCFTGETVFAFHEAFGVVAPYKVKTPFGVHGPTLLKLLSASKSNDMEMSLIKDGLSITAGLSEYTIPIKTPDEFSWKEPEFPSFELGSEIITAIESCLPTTSDNLALEAFNRICIKSYPPEHKICVYSTDGDALTKYITDLELTTPGDIDFCLSRDFCEALTKLEHDKDTTMKVGAEWVYVGSKDSYRMYGHNLGPTTVDYEVEIAKSVGKRASVGLVTIPDKLFDEALTRARVVADIETAATTILIENNEMLIQTMTPFGDVFDSININHPGIEISINAKLVQTSIQNCSSFKLTPNSSIFSGDKILRLVANLGK